MRLSSHGTAAVDIEDMCIGGDAVSDLVGHDGVSHGSSVHLSLK